MARTPRGNAARFQADIDSWFRASADTTYGGGGYAFVFDVALEVFSELVERTPVKTGQARGNWRLGVGFRKRGWSKFRKDPTGDRTVLAGFNALRGMQAAEPILWMSNDVPYALRLERGYSAQAPAGIVALTIEKFGNRYGIAGQGLAQYINTGRDRGRIGGARRAAA